MALPVNRPFDLRRCYCHTASVGATAVAAHTAPPTKGYLKKFGSILGGAITSADATITVAVDGTTVGTFTIANGSSAAGDFDSGEPTAVTFVNEDSVIRFTPSGASGSSIPCMFFADVEAA
jgi:hypothetical protein